MALSPSLETPLGQKSKKKRKTMAEEMVLHHQRMYLLYRQAVDF